MSVIDEAMPSASEPSDEKRTDKQSAVESHTSESLPSESLAVQPIARQSPTPQPVLQARAPRSAVRTSGWTPHGGVARPGNGRDYSDWITLGLVGISAIGVYFFVQGELHDAHQRKQQDNAAKAMDAAAKTIGKTNYGVLPPVVRTEMLATEADTDSQSNGELASLLMLDTSANAYVNRHVQAFRAMYWKGVFSTPALVQDDDATTWYNANLASGASKDDWNLYAQRGQKAIALNPFLAAVLPKEVSYLSPFQVDTFVTRAFEIQLQLEVATGSVNLRQLSDNLQKVAPFATGLPSTIGNGAKDNLVLLQKDIRAALTQSSHNGNLFKFAGWKVPKSLPPLTPHEVGKTLGFVLTFFHERSGVINTKLPPVADVSLHLQMDAIPAG